MRHAAYLLLGVLVCSLNLFAQAQSGTVVGTVTDQGGAVVPGAKVILTNEGTQFTRTVETNQAGQYTAYAFPTGRISLTVEHPGFQKLLRTGVELTAADTQTVDLQLQVGNVQQEIEVAAAATLLQTQTAAVSSLVTNQQILEIPLNGRTFTQLLQLGTGAIATSLGMQASTAGYGMRGSTSISVNGSMASGNSYLIDGFYNRSLWINNLIIVPTVDSIQEMRVMTSNYSAEYGASTGAVTVVQSKSGTNQIHGSAYEFLRNDKLDANTFFNNRSNTVKPPFRRNEFGGTIGGPVRKDKTFVFGDYQGIRLRQPSTVVSTVPTLAQRAMVQSGDFSTLSSTIFDPTALGPGPNNTQVRLPFAGNLIPVQRLDPAARKLIDLIPTPNQPGATRNYVWNPVATQRADQFDVRVDQNVGSADRLFLKYSYDNSVGASVPSLPTASSAGNLIGPNLAGGSYSTMKNWAAGINYTKVIGASIVNETRLGAIRWHLDVLPYNLDFNTSAAIGIPGININDRSGGLPDLNISGLTSLGAQSFYPESSPTISYQIEDILTKVKGNHTLKFGGYYIRHDFNGFSARDPRGLYDFNGQFTRQIGASGSGTVLADLALGAFDAADRGFLPGGFGLRMWNAAFFANDTWRVNNRMTVDIGLRYELQAPPYDVHDHWANFDIVTAKLRIANRDGNSRTLRNLDDNNFAPRLGITYMLTNDRKTVLRTGFGMSYVEVYNNGRQLFGNLPFSFQQVFTTDQTAAPAMRLSDGMPIPVAPAFNDPSINGGSPRAWDPSLRTPKAMQWSLGVQRELVANLLLDVSYVGTRTLDIMQQQNPNQAIPGPGAVDPRRPYYSRNPLLYDIDYRTNWGAAKYHSLQTRLQKRMSKGMSFSVAYTLSHNLNQNRDFTNSLPPQDYRCTRCEWGNANEDRRHVLVINHVYELPFGKGRSMVDHGPLSYVIGNWDLSGAWSMYSGMWNTATLASPRVNSSGEGVYRPDRLRNENLSNDQRSIDRWFDIAALVSPPQYVFGNDARNTVEGPGYFNLDLGVHRNFEINERARMAFRWEMFNAMNHANFNNPNVSIGSSSAGLISGTAAARKMQMALKITF